MPVTILEPTDGPQEVNGNTAPRPSNLKDKTLGVIDNGKHNSHYVLEQIAGKLKSKYGIKEVIYASKPSASLPIPQQQAEELAGKCDIVLAGVGD